jgi:hypothetical protein
MQLMFLRSQGALPPRREPACRSRDMSDSE